MLVFFLLDLQNQTLQYLLHHLSQGGDQSRWLCRRKLREEDDNIPVGGWIGVTVVVEHNLNLPSCWGNMEEKVWSISKPQLFLESKIRGEKGKREKPNPMFQNMHSFIPFQDGFLKPSLYSHILHQFLTNRCRNTFSKTILEKSSLKSCIYLKKCHRLSYDINFFQNHRKSNIVKDHFFSNGLTKCISPLI